jgi:hypothetical protein
MHLLVSGLRLETPLSKRSRRNMLQHGHHDANRATLSFPRHLLTTTIVMSFSSSSTTIQIERHLISTQYASNSVCSPSSSSMDEGDRWFSGGSVCVIRQTIDVVIKERPFVFLERTQMYLPSQTSKKASESTTAPLMIILPQPVGAAVMEHNRTLVGSLGKRPGE